MLKLSTLTPSILRNYKATISYKVMQISYKAIIKAIIRQTVTLEKPLITTNFKTASICYQYAFTIVQLSIYTTIMQGLITTFIKA